MYGGNGSIPYLFIISSIFISNIHLNASSKTSCIWKLNKFVWYFLFLLFLSEDFNRHIASKSFNFLVINISKDPPVFFSVRILTLRTVDLLNINRESESTYSGNCLNDIISLFSAIKSLESNGFS